MKQGTNVLARTIPTLTWMPKYQGVSLQPVLVAGAAAAAVVVPQAMAYATIEAS